MKSWNISSLVQADAWSLTLRWLVWAALADWLVTRTFTRSAIFMPKAPAVIAIYQALTLAGQVVATLTGLLAFVTLAWIIAREWRRRDMLGTVLAGCASLGLLFLFVAAFGWLAVAYHGLMLLVALLILWRAAQASWAGRLLHIGLLFPAASFISGEIYQLAPAIYQALRWPGPPPFTGFLFNLGELFAVISPIALWLAYGRNTSRRVWVVAAIPALVFGVMHFANPAMTGIIAIWSVGLTLYLPWPLYVVGLWLAAVTALAALRRNERIGWAILLLVAGGYTPQLTTHAFLGLIALWLLAAPNVQPAASRQPTTQEDRLPVPATALGHP